MIISRKQEKNQIDGLRKRGIGVSKTEDKLANELRKRNVPYKRQERIGRYRVDFCIPKSIVIDIQGPYHERFQQSAWDEKRLAYLEGRHIRVYVFSASEVYRSPGKYAELIAKEYKKVRCRRKRHTSFSATYAVSPNPS
jgi:very-short-patch-repair endonuclease